MESSSIIQDAELSIHKSASDSGESCSYHSRESESCHSRSVIESNKTSDDYDSSSDEEHPTEDQIHAICDALTNVASRQQINPGHNIEIETHDEVTGRTSVWSIAARPSLIQFGRPSLVPSPSLVQFGRPSLGAKDRRGSRLSMRTNQQGLTYIQSDLSPRPLSPPRNMTATSCTSIYESNDGIVTADDLRRKSREVRGKPKLSKQNLLDDLRRQSLMSRASALRNSTVAGAMLARNSFKRISLKLIRASKGSKPTGELLDSESPDTDGIMSSRSNVSTRSKLSYYMPRLSFVEGTAETQAGSEPVPYNYKRLSRMSRRSSSIKPCASAVTARVASDPEFSSAETANIILPCIDVKELFAKPAVTAVDAIGGAAVLPPVFSFTFKPELLKGSNKQGIRDSQQRTNYASRVSHSASTDLDNNIEFLVRNISKGCRTKLQRATGKVKSLNKLTSNTRMRKNHSTCSIRSNKSSLISIGENYRRTSSVVSREERRTKRGSRISIRSRTSACSTTSHLDRNVDSDENGQGRHSTRENPVRQPNDNFRRALLAILVVLLVYVISTSSGQSSHLQAFVLLVVIILVTIYKYWSVIKLWCSINVKDLCKQVGQLRMDRDTIQQKAQKSRAKKVGLKISPNAVSSTCSFQSTTGTRQEKSAKRSKRGKNKV